jgi:putative hydrolase of the HAD superfamily
MILPTNKIFVFDLDDTLYSERDFEKSGIEHVFDCFEINKLDLNLILNNRENWIDKIINSSNKNLTFSVILDKYRSHFPSIQLFKDSKILLERLLTLGCDLSLITDGRSITQRNKLIALGIESYFKNIIISEEVNSEKPSEGNFKSVMHDQHFENYIYIADNPSKDFITPNKLGWITVCLLDRGKNVHKQDFNLPSEYLPQFTINSFDEIILINE